MRYPRSVAIATAAVLLATPLSGGAASGTSYKKVPLFARFASDGTTLRSYVVPVQANVTVRKIISIRARLTGKMQYAKPNQINLALTRVSPQQRRVFARLATPRAWPQYYNLQLVQTRTVNGHKDYTIRGVPKNAGDAIDHLVADVSDGTSPAVTAHWFLRGNGTINIQIQTAMVRGYVLPVSDQTDIDVPGNRVHADVKYGSYAVTSEPKRSKISLR